MRNEICYSTGFNSWTNIIIFHKWAASTYQSDEDKFICRLYGLLIAITIWMICTHRFVQIVCSKCWENYNVSFHAKQERYPMNPEVKLNNIEIAYRFVQIVSSKYWENYNTSFHAWQESYPMKSEVNLDNIEIAYRLETKFRFKHEWI
jgi:hypothetical protein